MARWFVGTSATKITLANATDVSAIGPFTVTAWIYQLGGSCLIGDMTTNGGLQIQPVFTNFNLVKQQLANIGSSSQYLSMGVWRHIGVSYQNFGAYAFYTDGLPTGSGTSGVVFGSDPDTYAIGQNNNPEFFYGAISDLAWFKGILTPAEMWMLGTARARPLGLRRGAGNYVGYWPLDGRSGFGTEPDLSGNGNTGTVTGAALCPDPPKFKPSSSISMITKPYKGPGSASFNPAWAIGRNQFIEGFAS